MTTILVADDEPGLLESFSEIVVALGHECLRAEDGESALKLAREHHPDVVITDHMMPGKTGVDVARALQVDPVLQAVPVILVTAGRPSESDQKVAWRCLLKPVSVERLERVVNEALAHAARAKKAQAFTAKPSSSVSPVSFAREEMLNWVSHEIKSPLSAALTAAQLAERGLDHKEPSEATKKRLATIQRQLRRMDALVNSLLDAAALQHGKLELRFEFVELGEVVEFAVARWRDMHSEARFEIAPAPGPVRIEADRDRLEQIFDNLLSNALKYGNSESPIGIEVRLGEATAEVAVTDHGRGIPSEELAHVFDRFHRVPGQAGRGHGLGLYIAAALARLHGGEITVQSKVGEGSTFRVVLPYANTSA